MFFVVLTQKFSICLNETDVDKGVALGFDTTQDFTSQSTGNTIRLHQDKCFFNSGHEFSFF